MKKKSAAKNKATAFQPIPAVKKPESRVKSNVIDKQKDLRAK